MLRRVYFFLLVVLVPYFSFGSIKYFGPENGLPERRIFSVTFDGPAKCWVGGENDVYLFNGVQFFSYSHFLDTESSSKGTNHYVLLDRTADTRLLVANTHEIFLLEKSKKVHGKFSKKSLFKTNDNPFEYIFISKDSVLYGWNKDSIFYWHFGMKRPVFMKIKFGHKIEKTISGRLFLIGSFHLYEFKKGILKSTYQYSYL
jgi:hypothetical protein